MLHLWKQVIHKVKSSGKEIVIAWKCSNCGIAAGRHYPDWPEDRPSAHWLEATGIGEECTIDRIKQ